MRQIKIIVEKHPDGYVAYPLGVHGVVVVVVRDIVVALLAPVAAIWAERYPIVFAV